MAKLSNGRGCAQAGECLSSLCEDGVCCAERCESACAACNVKGREGGCANLPAGSAGAPSCHPFVCSGASPLCPWCCALDGECAGGYRCEQGSCVGRDGG
ncbi:MAG: hypothetical protein HYZ28_09410 [Myxococcales bacterium]|nr:hypothetical protein [Myxococcales bacterium]